MLKSETKPGARGGLEQLAYILLSMLVSFIVAALFISLTGTNPLTAFLAMAKGIFINPQGFSNVLLKATPIIFIGLGVCICLSGGYSNLGGDGQLVIGGIASAMVGIWLDGTVPYPLLFLLALLAGMLGGGLWGGIAGALKVRFGMNTIIVTIMLNYIANNLILYLVEGPFKGPGSYLPQTANVPKALELKSIIPGLRVHAGFLLALVLAFAVHFMLKRTVLGYRIQAIGRSPKAAVYSGIRENSYALLLLFAAGAFSGLAGMVEVYGIHYRVLDGIASGYGYLGISAALLARNNPLALLLTSTFFGALAVGANAMQVEMNIPNSIVDVTQGIIILFMMVSPGIAAAFRARRAGGAKAANTPAAQQGG